ncbi:hypothetical protein GQ43DRAFT_316045 [Delitschia confertaspora ATCC 74209]|uniref:Uncharacterized protein n=1 Tax=Delitschia confertaspora ATCC 74209 TaxID=1513339 RepID=A0A9P4JNF1_9PLEO|nr:hypothetical protein GQ43DRAFT_316045 [Delitschia confertaspora ATCC 74209]
MVQSPFIPITWTLAVSNWQRHPWFTWSVDRYAQNNGLVAQYLANLRSSQRFRATPHCCKRCSDLQATGSLVTPVVEGFRGNNWPYLVGNVQEALGLDPATRSARRKSVHNYTDQVRNMGVHEDCSMSRRERKGAEKCSGWSTRWIAAGHKQTTSWENVGWRRQYWMDG